MTLSKGCCLAKNCKITTFSLDCYQPFKQDWEKDANKSSSDWFHEWFHPWFHQRFHQRFCEKFHETLLWQETAKSRRSLYLLSTLQAGLRKDANKVESIYALLKWSINICNYSLFFIQHANAGHVLFPAAAITGFQSLAIREITVIGNYSDWYAFCLIVGKNLNVQYFYSKNILQLQFYKIEN